MAALRLVYKPLGAVAGALGGLAASAVFTRVWRSVGDGDDAPQPTDRRSTWGDVLLAAALHGAVYGVVRATVDRAGAIGFSKATGEWPGDD